jgi:2,3-dihydroxybenzoate decarboxylase
MKLIDFEAHFFTEDYVAYLRERTAAPRLETVETAGQKEERLWLNEDLYALRTHTLQPLLDFEDVRLAEMDAAGVSMQVLTLGGPGCEPFESSEGVEMASKSNDDLAKVIRKHPDRFVGFAALAPQDPDKAADELERCVRDLGFRGGKINSHVQGEYLDNEKYRGIFERAEKLDVPIYLHPRLPSPDMIKPYADYGYGLAGAALGFAAETQLHAYRLIYSGLFDKYPGLKILLGHMGEGLPYWMFRMDYPWLSRSGGRTPLARKPSDYVSTNFIMTTSGMFYMPAFMCAYLALGAGNIVFASDYPFEKSTQAAAFMGRLPVADKDKEKICFGNAERLLKL